MSSNYSNVDQWKMLAFHLSTKQRGNISRFLYHQNMHGSIFSKLIHPQTSSSFPRFLSQFLIRDEDYENINTVEDLQEFNKTIVKLGEALNIPVVATCDVHFMDPADSIFRKILMYDKFADAEYQPPLYLRTTDEMLEEFSYLGKETAYDVVVRNTNLIADWCEPIEPLPKGLFAPKLEDSDGELKRLVWGKAHELYGEEPPQIVVDRINVELGDIIRCKYDVIYMSAQKLVQNSLEHGYLVGSRG